MSEITVHCDIQNKDVVSVGLKFTDLVHNTIMEKLDVNKSLYSVFCDGEEITRDQQTQDTIIQDGATLNISFIKKIEENMDLALKASGGRVNLYNEKDIGAAAVVIVEGGERNLEILMPCYHIVHTLGLTTA